jgi:Zn-dependent protease with chaperone function
MSAADWNDVPEQNVLVEQLRRSNQLATRWHLFLGAGAVGLAFLVDWQWVMREPLYTIVVLLLVPSQYFPSVAMTLLKKRKRVEELSENFQAGAFSKPRLLSTIREVATTLGIDHRRVPFYLTRDKDLNAYAVSIGLSNLLPSVRGVYINRQTLHVSTPTGLKATIGHELGHLFPYELKWHGGWLAKLCFGGLLALFVLQKTGDPSAWGLIAATAAAWGFLYLDSIPHSRMSQPLEFLCDGLGAKASGVEAAISDLLNFGNECQAQYELSIAALKLAAQGKAISDVEAMKIYEDSLGYGPTDVDSTMARIRDAIANEKNANKGLSLGGLVDFMWRDNVADSQASEARDAAILIFEALNAMPQIDWKEVTNWDPEIELSDLQIKALIDEILASPDKLLFVLPTEPAGNESLSHPSFRKRILYLWKNRKAIEDLRAIV